MSSQKVVTEKSSIQCGLTPGHQGTVKVTTSPKVLTIGGDAGVVGKADLLSASITFCQNPQLTPTPGQECKTVVSVSDAAVAKCLTVNGGGNGVVLAVATAGQTSGAPPGTLPIKDANQDVLTAQ